MIRRAFHDRWTVILLGRCLTYLPLHLPKTQARYTERFRFRNRRQDSRTSLSVREAKRIAVKRRHTRHKPRTTTPASQPDRGFISY